MIFPSVDNALLVVVDLQEKLLPVIYDAENIIRRSEIMLAGAKELGMDIVVTEQYPKGLGHTVPVLSKYFSDGIPVIEKSSFSVFEDSGFRKALASRTRKVLIFIGVEMGVCLLQSVLDAVAAGYEVIVAADAVGSRKVLDRDLAFEAVKAAGAYVLSSESILFMLLRDSKNPHFKAVSGLIK